MINITKSWLFEEIKKKRSTRPLVRLTRKKSKDPKIKVSIERGEITTHTIEISSKSYKNAAAAAKSLQSWPTLCDPIDSSTPGSPIPRIFQARTLEWVAISFSIA